jgi:hypothetical protein
MIDPHQEEGMTPQKTPGRTSEKSPRQSGRHSKRKKKESISIAKYINTGRRVITPRECMN